MVNRSRKHRGSRGGRDRTNRGWPSGGGTSGLPVAQEIAEEIPHQVADVVARVRERRRVILPQQNFTVASFPRWSRAFHGSPAGFKFIIENASMNFYPVRVQELLVLEADAILMRSRGGASWVHVRQELCFSADCGHLLFVTCGDTPTAFATFHAATGWFAPCPIQVDARGVREVIARWIVAPPRGSRGDRSDVRA